MNSDIFYVGIENPGAFRRSLLECSKDVIHFLQKYEKLKSIKAQKHAHLTELKLIYQDLAHLMAELRAEMPKVEPGSLPKPKAETPKKEEKHEETHKAPKRLTGVEKLEAELGRIEEKLRSIS